MPAFAYSAIDSAGQKVSGSLSVKNKAEAYRELESRSLMPIQVSEEAEKGKKGKSRGKGKGISDGPVKLTRQQMILFTEELADLQDAGLQLEQGLRILDERQQDKALRTTAAILREEIREGASFSKALKKASPSFDDLYCNLIAAGEASGQLTDILRRVALNMKQLYDLQRRTTSALVYPAMLLLGCVVLLFVFSTVLMPQLTEMISKTGQDLPFVTELLMKFTGFMGKWWWLVLIVMVMTAILFRAYIGSPKGRLWWDAAKFKIPAFGPVVAGRFFAQFCHTMSNLVNNGVPLLNSLKLISRGTTNVFMKNHLETAVLDVGEGNSLAKTLDKAGTFPEQLIDRIAIGEQTGELGKAFAKAAAKYDEDLDVRINRLTTIVPNVILVLMALIVGVVAYSIITTIFGSMSGIRNRA